MENLLCIYSKNDRQQNSQLRRIYSADMDFFFYKTESFLARSLAKFYDQ